jgi:anti-sigma factor RsiW
MSTGCHDIRMKIGELVDGELPGAVRNSVEEHLASCEACRRELDGLKTLTRRLAGQTQVTAPAGLWTAVENRLDRRTDSPTRPAPRTRPGVLRFASRALAAAAVLVLVVGFGWLAVSGPWQARAAAAHIDFRPLLERADGDIAAGIQALMRAYGGEPISAKEAAERMPVRVHAPAELPSGLRLQGRYLLSMGRSHSALAFHYVGPTEKHLLLLQCPPDVEKDYGNFECISCSVGGHHGHGVQVGKLRLMHMASENVCVCVVSTLDESELKSAIDAVKITF